MESLAPISGCACRFFGMVLGTLVIGGCGVIVLPAVRDLSGFEEFYYEVRGALGFCPTENTVVEATIRREADGEYSVELTIFEGDSDGESVFRDEPARLLTADERDRMLQLFRRVQLRFSTLHPICFTLDPCALGRYRWDDTLLINLFCPQPYIDADYAGRVNEFLESLRTDVD